VGCGVLSVFFFFFFFFFNNKVSFLLLFLASLSLFLLGSGEHRPFGNQIHGTWELEEILQIIKW
jgi:hypothetical protein